MTETVDQGRASEQDLLGVLVAYGDQFARTGLRTLLNSQPDIAVVACAADGHEALVLAGQIEPDVLLVDAELPGIDAIELTRRVTVDANAPRGHVLMLGASEDDGAVMPSLHAGASGFLRRDTEPAELVRAVRAVAAGGAALSPCVVRRVIAELISRPDPRLPGPDQLDELTARERQVMALVAAGLSNDQIAEHLVVTRATARTHVSRALGKLRLGNRAQLVTLAYETGLVRPKKTPVARMSTGTELLGTDPKPEGTKRGSEAGDHVSLRP
jgi:DNA-binding NarL/FixJ family response regulator